MNKEYIITVFSENKVGLLSQITTVFTCRDINIESLTTSESSIPGIHKFTIVVITDPEKIEKLVKQEIALYKVTRSNSVEKLVRDHHVRILEICDDYIVLEKTGHKEDTQSLFELLQPHGVQQFVRSSQIAIIKSKRELLNEYLQKRENTTKA